MTCDVVVVSYCSSKQLPGCLAAVEKNVNDLEGCRVFVVDNASTDNSVGCVRGSFPSVTIIENEKNVGYGAAINRALAQSEAEYIVCMNPDVRLQSGAITALITCANRHADAVAVAPNMMYPDGTFHAVCRRFPSIWRNFCHVSGLAARLPKSSPSRHWLSESQHASECDVDMVSGACVLFRRDYLDKIGQFDENIFLYEEESDVFLPTRKLGGRAYYCPEAEVVHEHGASSTNSSHEISSLNRLRSKYYIYREHFGSVSSRIVYVTDRIVFGISFIRHYFTQQRNSKKLQFNQAREAYESLDSITGKRNR